MKLFLLFWQSVEYRARHRENFHSLVKGTVSHASRLLKEKRFHGHGLSSLPCRVADKLSGTRSRGGSSPNPAVEKCDMGRLQNFCARSGELCVGNLIATTPI